MTKFSSPYRFIPFNEKVFIPSWFDENRPPIDWPYKDGISGKIALKIKTITPLFIGAEKKENSPVKEIFKINGNPAIPGTSLKGAIRSVIEAITFGSMQGRIDDRKLSIRDLHNNQDYLSHLVGMDNKGKPKSRAGWLSIDSNNEWKLQECDYSVVQQVDLEAYIQKSREKKVNLGYKDSAKNKYQKWGFENRNISFTAGPWQRNMGDSFADERELSRASNLGTGETKGTLVLTGQPQDRNNKNAKKLEFIFHNIIGEEKTVPENVRIDFEAIHRDATTKKPNDEWTFWLDKAKANRGGSFKIPVFWVEGATSSDNEFPVRAMGLALMFRLAYKKSIHDAAKQKIGNSDNDFNGELDFADLLFGCVRDDGAKSLKGRANFTHALMSKGRIENQPRTETLLSPKPSFYPSYIRQNNHYKSGQDDYKTNSYTTLMADKAKIRGYKRYPASNQCRPSTQSNIGSRNSVNTDVQTKFTPVAAGSEFECELRIFNLLPVELGALIWVLTWGNKQDHAHMLGGAKPLGYGAVEITIDEVNTKLAKVNDPDYKQISSTDAKIILNDAVTQFTNHMNGVAKNIANRDVWEETEQVREALASANLNIGDNLAKSAKLKNMEVKDFINIKKEGLILPLASGEIDEKSTPSKHAPIQNSPAGGHGGGANQGNFKKRNISNAPTALYKNGDLVVNIDEKEGFGDAIVAEDQLSSNQMVKIEYSDGESEEVGAKSLKRR